MEIGTTTVGSPSGAERPTEDRMLREDVVKEILARLARGEGVKQIARELGVDRKTVKAWRRRGTWRPRPSGRRRRTLDAFRDFVDKRAPEVGWNGAVHRELQGLGFTGGYLQVRRYLQPQRGARQWAALATTRFETAPGEQAQVDFGQLRVWIGEHETVVHLFVFTLGYSRLLLLASDCTHFDAAGCGCKFRNIPLAHRDFFRNFPPPVPKLSPAPACRPMLAPRGVGIAYRETGMVEVREIVRRWQHGDGIRAIARGTGLDRKTVRVYLRAAVAAAVVRGGEPPTDAQIGAMATARRPGRPTTPPC